MKKRKPTKITDTPPGLQKLPAHERRRLIKRITEYITGSFRQRAKQILQDPGEFKANIHEVRWLICGSFAQDLEFEFGDDIEEMIQAAYKDAGLPTSAPEPIKKPAAKTRSSPSRR